MLIALIARSPIMINNPIAIMNPTQAGRVGTEKHTDFTKFPKFWKPVD